MRWTERERVTFPWYPHQNPSSYFSALHCIPSEVLDLDLIDFQR